MRVEHPWTQREWAGNAGDSPRWLNVHGLCNFLATLALNVHSKTVNAEACFY